MMSRSLSSYMEEYNPLYPLCHSTEVFGFDFRQTKEDMADVFSTSLPTSTSSSSLGLHSSLSCSTPVSKGALHKVCRCVCRDHQAPREGGQIISSHNMRCPFVHRTQRKAIIAHFLDSSPIRVLYRHRFLRASFSGSFLSVSLPPVRTILLH